VKEIMLKEADIINMEVYKRRKRVEINIEEG